MDLVKPDDFEATRVHEYDELLAAVNDRLLEAKETWGGQNTLTIELAGLYSRSSRQKVAEKFENAGWVRVEHFTNSISGLFTTFRFTMRSV